jgi:CRAL/TRIO domain
VTDAILETVKWRHDFGINTIDPSEFKHLIAKGIGYTNGYDKHGRAIMYLKIGRNDEMQSKEVYEKFLMYTVER